MKFILKFKIFWQCPFEEKGGFCELLSKPNSLMFDHQKSQPLCRLDALHFSLRRKTLKIT